MAGVSDPVGGGKKLSESRLGMVAAKSGGVTSETNHGMSLGLGVVNKCTLRYSKSERHVLEDHF